MKYGRRLGSDGRAAQRRQATPRGCYGQGVTRFGACGPPSSLRTLGSSLRPKQRTHLVAYPLGGTHRAGPKQEGNYAEAEEVSERRRGTRSDERHDARGAHPFGGDVCQHNAHLQGVCEPPDRRALPRHRHRNADLQAKGHVDLLEPAGTEGDKWSSGHERKDDPERRDRPDELCRNDRGLLLGHDNRGPLWTQGERRMASNGDEPRRTKGDNGSSRPGGGGLHLVWHLYGPGRRHRSRDHRYRWWRGWWTGRGRRRWRWGRAGWHRSRAGIGYPGDSTYSPDRSRWSRATRPRRVPSHSGWLGWDDQDSAERSRPRDCPRGQRGHSPVPTFGRRCSGRSRS